MYSRILDQQTLGAVIAAAPEVGGRPGDLATEIMTVLEQENGEPKLATRMIRNGVTYYSMSLMDLSSKMTNNPSAKMVGGVLSDLGLTKQRLNDGYHLFWNEAQLAILRQVLGLQEEDIRYRVTGTGLQVLSEVENE